MYFYEHVLMYSSSLSFFLSSVSPSRSLFFKGSTPGGGVPHIFFLSTIFLCALSFSLGSL